MQSDSTSGMYSKERIQFGASFKHARMCDVPFFGLVCKELATSCGMVVFHFNMVVRGPAV